MGRQLECEIGAGALARTHYGRLADVAGTDPASGAWTEEGVWR